MMELLTKYQHEMILRRGDSTRKSLLLRYFMGPLQLFAGAAGCQHAQFLRRLSHCPRRNAIPPAASASRTAFVVMADRITLRLNRRLDISRRILWRRMEVRVSLLSYMARAVPPSPFHARDAAAAAAATPPCRRHI